MGWSQHEHKFSGVVKGLQDRYDSTLRHRVKIVVISHHGGAVSTRDVKTGKDLPQPLNDKILDELQGTAPEPSPMGRSQGV